MQDALTAQPDPLDSWFFVAIDLMALLCGGIGEGVGSRCSELGSRCNMYPSLKSWLGLHVHIFFVYLDDGLCGAGSDFAGLVSILYSLQKDLCSRA